MIPMHKSSSRTNELIGHDQVDEQHRRDLPVWDTRPNDMRIAHHLSNQYPTTLLETKHTRTLSPPESPNHKLVSGGFLHDFGTGAREGDGHVLDHL